MIRRPPRSPLFPTRRSSDLRTYRLGPDKTAEVEDDTLGATAARSEEHTSELQSLTNLVCRLLLEKKKQIRAHNNPPDVQEPPATTSHALRYHPSAYTLGHDT